MDEAPRALRGGQDQHGEGTAGEGRQAKGPKGGRTRRAAQRARNVKSRRPPGEAGEPEGRDGQLLPFSGTASTEFPATWVNGAFLIQLRRFIGFVRI